MQHLPAHQPRFPRSLQLALAFWLILLLALSVRTALRPVSHTVFPVFALGAERWWADQSLYEKDEEVDYFRYPPVFAVAMSPFAFLGPRAGGIVWATTGVAIYLAGLWLYARDVLRGKFEPNQLALFLVLAGIGASRGLWNGQSNAHIMGFLLLGAAALATERWWLASTYLAIAVWFKLTPVAPVLLLAALWPTRLLPRLAITLLIGGLLPFLTRPPDTVLEQYGHWWTHLFSSSSERWPGFRDAWTAWQAVRETFDGVVRPFPFKEPLESTLYRLLQGSAALSALLGVLWVKARQIPRPVQVNLALAAGCTWLMLFGPSVEHASFAFLAPLLAWAVLDRQTWPRGQGLILTAFTLVTFLSWGGLTRSLVDLLPIVLLPLPLGTALFACWLVGHARNEAQLAQTSSHAPTTRNLQAA